MRAAEPGLMRLAALLADGRVSAEDLVQTTFLRAWPHRRRLERMDHPVAYLRRILVNEARRSQRTSLPRLWERDPVAPDPAQGIADKALLAQVLTSLPTRQRMSLVLRHYCQLSEQETADLMGCSVGTVKSSTSRAIEALRAAHPALLSGQELT